MKRLNAPKYKDMSTMQKEKAVEYCVDAWKTTHHRAEDALRFMESMAWKL